MRISLFTSNGNSVLVSDDNKCFVTIFSVDGSVESGTLRIGNNEYEVENGESTPEIDLLDGYYEGCFVSDDGTEYIPNTKFHVRNKEAETSFGSSSYSRYAQVMEMLEKLTIKVYEYEKEVGELRATKFYDSMGVFDQDENNEEEET